ncbi:alpha/beta hydrolase [Ancylothrix sp. C2]|uniref:alpha/beta hydrolase n=1 Tax=Ancylothrix sp. D3o TaxID=2953691 RepID=UPI0021BA5FD5|nr:alpha/beta hydrolase [Ancylothrix sp. D3o]MCT7949842.1 alpha/beta hydrolase [Ancylothrix sp. D3o]
MKQQFKWPLKLLGFVTATAITGLTNLTNTAEAAQTLVVRKSIFSESIDVADLRKIAETGTVPSNLQGYAKRLSTEQRTAILAALRAKVPLGVVAISRLLNTRIGSTILADIASVTDRPAASAGVQALRAAMVLGSNAPGGLSIVSFIENYPSERLVIDLDRTFEVMGSLNTGFWQTQQFMSAISPQLAPQQVSLNLPFNAAEMGKNSAKVINLSLNDSARNRAIPVDIYWSEGATIDKPVIVFSHGMASVKTDMKYLAEHLASHGFIVAALEHPGSNETHVNAALAGGPLIEPQEFLNRPKDVSFVLDELAKLNQTSGPLQGKIATDNSLVVGYSLGGSTALSLAGAELQLENLRKSCQSNLVAFSFGETLQCIAGFLPENTYKLGDPRIKRAVALNPTTSLLFGETGMSKVEVPVLMLAGSADKTTPAFREQIVPFSKLPTPKLLVGIGGGTHLSVKDPSKTMDQAGQPSTLFSGDEVVGEQAVDIRNYTKAIVLAFAGQMTADAERYNIFLSSEYAQSASTQNFPIRLIDDIPPQAVPIVESFMKNP